jgi:hypothetical protein
MYTNNSISDPLHQIHFESRSRKALNLFRENATNSWKTQKHVWLHFIHLSKFIIVSNYIQHITRRPVTFKISTWNNTYPKLRENMPKLSLCTTIIHLRSPKYIWYTEGLWLKGGSHVFENAYGTSWTTVLNLAKPPSWIGTENRHL